MHESGTNAECLDEARPSRAAAVVRRLAVVAMVLSLSLVASVSIAGASAYSRVNGSVSGQAPFDFGTARRFVHQQIITTVDITHGPSATLTVDSCVDFGANDFVLDGTFVFSGRSGTLTDREGDREHDRESDSGRPHIDRCARHAGFGNTTAQCTWPSCGVRTRWTVAQ